jgi:hypothetical protein
MIRNSFARHELKTWHQNNDGRGLFMPGIHKIDRRPAKPDPRDRLIIALYAQLKAERQTRETLEWVIRNGGLSHEVLEAIASDPVPVVTSEDIASVEKIIALDERRKNTRRGND